MSATCGFARNFILWTRPTLETLTFTSLTFALDGLLTARSRPPLTRMGTSSAGNEGDHFQRPA